MNHLKLALALSATLTAYSATISSVSVSTDAAIGSSCSQTSTTSAYCHSDGYYPGFGNTGATATASLAGMEAFSLSSSISGGPADAFAKALITTDDFYSISSQAPVFGKFSIICDYGLQNYTGYAQYSFGGGPLTYCASQDPSLTHLLFPVSVTNGTVELRTHLEGNAVSNSSSAEVNAQISFLGFQDGSGNSVAYSLGAVPEPGTGGILAGGLAVLVFRYRVKRQKRVSGPNEVYE